MSTTVTFAGILAEAPGLLHTRENQPFVTCRVLVDRRVQNDQGEWVSDETTVHNVRIFGSAATHVHDSWYNPPMVNPTMAPSSGS